MSREKGVADSQELVLLAAGIRQSDPWAAEELYRIINREVRFKLQRQMSPAEANDRLHDIYIIVVQTIRRGRLRDPERLLGFIWTVAQRQVARHVRDEVDARQKFQFIDEGWNCSEVPSNENPQDNMLVREKTAILAGAMAKLSERDREVLRRFYLQQQRATQICKEMGLTETQFRLVKWRAKAKLRVAALRVMGRPQRMPVAPADLPVTQKRPQSSSVPARCSVAGVD